MTMAVQHAACAALADVAGVGLAAVDVPATGQDAQEEHDHEKAPHHRGLLVCSAIA